MLEVLLVFEFGTGDEGGAMFEFGMVAEFWAGVEGGFWFWSLGVMLEVELVVEVRGWCWGGVCAGDGD